MQWRRRSRAVPIFLPIRISVRRFVVMLIAGDGFVLSKGCAAGGLLGFPGRAVGWSIMLLHLSEVGCVIRLFGRVRHGDATSEALNGPGGLVEIGEVIDLAALKTTAETHSASDGRSEMSGNRIGLRMWSECQRVARVINRVTSLAMQGKMSAKVTCKRANRGSKCDSPRQL